MKIPVQYPLTGEQLQQFLSQALPQYTTTLRGKNMAVVAKSATVGANVVARKNAIVVVASFPNMGAQMGFVFAVLFLGVLIPLLIYFIAWYGAQRRVEKEVGETLQAWLSGAYQQPQPVVHGGWQPTA